MILDNIKNAETYYNLSARIQTAFEYLKQTDLKALECGKHSICGDDIYISVQEYNTKPLEEGKWEAHRQYIDIQFMIKGSEDMGCTDVEPLIPVTEYDEEKDLIFFKNAEGNFFEVRENCFAIFFPQDAHMPCLSVDKSTLIKKAIVKIRL